MLLRDQHLDVTAAVTGGNCGVEERLIEKTLANPRFDRNPWLSSLLYDIAKDYPDKNVSIVPALVPYGPEWHNKIASEFAIKGDGFDFAMWDSQSNEFILLQSLVPQVPLFWQPPVPEAVEQLLHPAIRYLYLVEVFLRMMDQVGTLAS